MGNDPIETLFNNLKCPWPHSDTYRVIETVQELEKAEEKNGPRVARSIICDYTFSVNPKRGNPQTR
jgi:hypothetical protein